MQMTETTTHLVQVWFGDEAIRSLVADDLARAEHYAEAMERQFLGLQITITETADRPTGTHLPSNSALWPLTVK